MPSPRTRPRTGARRDRRGNPLLRERVHDPYRLDAKARSPQACPQCGALYRNGRWVWDRSRPQQLKLTLCPACRRINDTYPAGELLLCGAFVRTHALEVLELVRNIERLECSEHPLHRIIDIGRSEDSILVTTTDIHLPRRIGHALENAWQGQLQTHYDNAGYFVRVSWQRDDVRSHRPASI